MGLEVWREQPGRTYLLARKFLSVLLVIFSNIDHGLAAEGGDSHPAHFGNFPVAISIGVGLASGLAFRADLGLLRGRSSIGTDVLGV